MQREAAAAAAAATSAGSYSAAAAEAEVDINVLSNYLLQLPAEELVATLQPIRALLPTESHPTGDAAPASSIPLCTSPLSPDVTHSQCDAGMPLSPPLSVSLESVSSWTSVQLQLVWSRCVSLSVWRRSIPSELLQHCFSFLDVPSLLLSAAPVSKYWLSESSELARESPHWRAHIAERRLNRQRQNKIKMYRRLTHEQ